jgi:hypothetical protein
MQESRDNWIVATGQIWKLYVALAGFIGALGCFTVAVFSLGGGSGLTSRMTIAGVILATVSFAWLSMVLCCPHCTTPLVWKMIRMRPHTSWLIDLAGLETCPICNRSLRQVR